MKKLDRSMQKELTTKRKDLEIQLLCLTALASNADEKNLLEQLNKLYEKIPSKNSFREPLKNFIQNITNKMNAQKAEWTIDDSDDPCDILLIGTEVHSCQHINESSNLTRCLLSYLLDGKYRALIVRDKEGKINARSIVRMMYDPIKKEFVLFQENLYALNKDPKLFKALRMMAIRRAKELGVSCIISTLEELDSDKVQESYSAYPNPIHSMGGPLPIEMVDASQANNILRGPYSLDQHLYLIA